MVFILLESAPGESRSSHVIFLKVMLNFYQLVPLVVDRGTARLASPITDLFSFKIVMLNNSDNPIGFCIVPLLSAYGRLLLNIAAPLLLLVILQAT